MAVCNVKYKCFNCANEVFYPQHGLNFICSFCIKIGIVARMHEVRGIELKTKEQSQLDYTKRPMRGGYF